jgi:hypothetical protein
MLQRFNIRQARNKSIWPTLSNQYYRPLRQIDFSLSFNIQPGGVKGWFDDPRQTFNLQQVERGSVMLDYGPNIHAGRVIFQHPLLMQDEVDALAMMSHSRPDTYWMLTSHRRDMIHARLTEDWSATSHHTILDEPWSDEPTPGPAVERQSIYWDHYSSRLICARVIDGVVYAGVLGDALEEVAEGNNPSVVADENGIIHVAYDRDGLLFVSKNVGLLWLHSLVTQNEPEFYPGETLYDSDHTYHNPVLICVGDRLWLFYLKTKDEESVIQYRLEAQKWLLEYPVPTMAGNKTSLAACFVRDNLKLRDRIVLAWISWDLDRDPSPGPDQENSTVPTNRVPNVYRTYSSVPRQNYGVDQSGAYVTTANDITPISSIPMPRDSMSYALISPPYYTN